MLELGLKTLIAYLLGSVLGALLVGALRGVDIREQGSGNAGGTNAWRTQGLGFALAVVVVDVGKGWLAAGPLVGWQIPGVGLDTAVSRDWLAASCASAAIAGHVWPQWHEFRGGKGGATLIGALIALAPLAIPVALAAWLLVVMLSGFVGLATVTAAAAVPAALAWWLPAPAALVVFGVAMALFIGWAHRSNIRRMQRGQEPRVTRLWLLGPRNPQ